MSRESKLTRPSTEGMTPLKMVSRSDRISAIFVILPSNKIIKTMVIQWNFPNTRDINVKE
jgi:hypothetical protein